MSNESNDTDRTPHSAAYFGDARDFWWNRDFLGLMSRRWGLDRVGSVLDVGCGVGHWGRVLLPFLPEITSLVGVDGEAEWVAEASARADEAGIADRVSYLQATAEALPFPDAAFDMVTCQTVLIHVADREKAVREMMRVLKPGGLLAVAEPNNLASSLVTNSIGNTIAEVLETVELHLTCERGKEALGLGNNSAGDLIPGLFAACGLVDIAVYTSDKATPLFPPYASSEQQVVIRQAVEWAGKDFWIWDRSECNRYFLAGGGMQDRFDELWHRMRAGAPEFVDAVQAERFHTAGGVIMYLVSGRKAAVDGQDAAERHAGDGSTRQ